MGGGDDATSGYVQSPTAAQAASASAARSAPIDAHHEAAEGERQRAALAAASPGLVLGAHPHSHHHAHGQAHHHRHLSHSPHSPASSSLLSLERPVGAEGSSYADDQHSSPGDLAQQPEEYRRYEPVTVTQDVYVPQQSPLKCD